MMNHLLHRRHKIGLIVCTLILMLPALATAQSVITHTVQAQETVYSISRKYGVSEEEIYKLNEGSQLGIRIGQQLRIPTAKPTTPDVKAPVQVAQSGTHIVAKGETLYSISHQYGLSLSELLALNPSITGSQITEGEVLIVKEGAKGQTPKRNPLDGTEEHVVRVGIILPIAQTGQPKRYLNFYEGMILAVEQMQRQGINMILQVEGAKDNQALRSLINTGFAKDCDLLIGGDSEQSVSLLADYAAQRNMIYVSPFVWQSGRASRYEKFYQINPDQQDITPLIAKAFVHHFNSYQIVSVKCGKADQGDKVLAIEQACKQDGIELHSRSMQELSMGKWPTFNGKKIVLIPNSSSLKDLQQLLAIAAKQRETTGATIRLFGYPQWQSYGDNVLSKLHETQSVIYSTFYFDNGQAESARLLNEYQQWYNHADAATYPRYSVLGYDVMRFFVPAIAGYGRNFDQYLSQLPTDGLQTGFCFTPTGSKGSGYTNLNLFFITYLSDGKVYRKRVSSL